MNCPDDAVTVQRLPPCPWQAPCEVLVKALRARRASTKQNVRLQMAKREMLAGIPLTCIRKGKRRYEEGAALVMEAGIVRSEVGVSYGVACVHVQLQSPHAHMG